MNANGLLTKRPPRTDSTAAAVLASVSRQARSADNRTRAQVYGGIALFGITVLLLWEFAIGFIVEPRYVSKPSEVGARLVELALDGILWQHIGATMSAAGAGYLIGVVVGLGAAMMLVAFPLLDEICDPFLAAFYSVPKIALAPLFIMWFGLDALPKVLLAALMVFLIVLVNSVAGVRGISPGLIDVSRVFGAKGLLLARKVVLPGAAPAVMASIRLTFTRAMVGAILGEFIASTQGLGFLIVRASRQFDTATVFAGVLVVALLVMLVNALIRAAEARLLPWSTSEVRG
jgi:NitT/TauT family transport system permease protein